MDPIGNGLGVSPSNRMVVCTPGLVDAALRSREEYHYGFNDSPIIAGALAFASAVLYSEDPRHGQVIGGRLAVRSPFRK